jgi:hypothetical protein
VTPVALFLFNRPETTAAVFEVIRRARPATLLAIADAPRPDHPGDGDACAAARAILDRVDWPCDLRRQFAEEHLGLKSRVESGLTWVFSQFDRAIVLEDDCVPEITFFRFCEELLARYADDPAVLSISGNNFQFGRVRGEASYYFSRNCHIWGWATWARAWALHDPEMSEWPAAKAEGWLDGLLATRHERQYWSYLFETNYRTRHTWDYAWLFSYRRRGGVHVVPNVNLVSNHGFGTAATHTRLADSLFASLPTQPMEFPLVHPPTTPVDVEADAFTEDVLYSGNLRRALERGRGRKRPHQ